MPQLTWATKSLPDPVPAALSQEAIIFPWGHGYPDALPEHAVFLGDNLRVMASLLGQYTGRLDLIYADPPFFTNKRYSTRVGRGENSRRPQEWQLAEGYADAWEDLDTYLDFLYPRLALMHRLLSPNGSLYLHLDWHASAYARLLLDELFGRERFLNEIVWLYHGPSPIRRAFNRKHDTILVYTKGESYTFNADAVREPYHPNTVKTFASSRRAGFGKVPDLKRGKVPEDWWYFPVVARLHHERTGYPTQKPESLLKRIVLASSNPGDLVADFFCGSGTFPLIAAQLQRRILACDCSWRAIHTTRGRLLEQPGVFTLQVDEACPIPEASTCPAIRRSGKTVSLTDNRSIDYWEVDPAWDGRTFRSARQALRPKRMGELPLEIKLPAKTGKVCIRAVGIDGKQMTKIV
jgi:DNA modification methylase